MKIDRYTQIVLTTTAIFLGLLVLGHGSGPSTVVAQPQAAAGAFASVEFIPYGRTGFIMFERTTGGVWVYDVAGPDPALPLKLVGSGGRIDKPGARVQKLQ